MIGTYPVVELAEKVKLKVKSERFAHILRVAELAEAIARANALDADKAYLAAILHDVARDLSPEQLFELAPPVLELERQHPLALHGRAGRRIAEGWGVDDPEVLEAIEGHVYGVSPENKVGMAVYVADVSEPGRGFNHEIRALALQGGLLEAYRQAVMAKITYLKGRGIEPHPRTLAAYEALTHPDLA